MNKLKGTLLEKIVECLLKSCGFQNVIEDGIYVHKTGDGLRFINGKGAKHDADVLLAPPYQTPFSYPVRFLVECKAYPTDRVGLDIIRGALGLVNDINDFEVITLEQLKERKKTRRVKYAVEQRERFNYHIAVASINGFTADAIEFACNYKIPLIDLSQYIQDIKQDFIEIGAVGIESQAQLLGEIKGSFPYLTTNELNIANEILGDAAEDRVNIVPSLQHIANKTILAMNKILVGALPSGETLLLSADSTSKDILVEAQKEALIEEYPFTLHFDEHGSNKWYGSMMQEGREARFYFELPDQLFRIWGESNFDLQQALNIKEKYLNRIQIIGTHGGRQICLNLNIPGDWFKVIRQHYNG